MRIKVGNQWFQCEPGQPVMVELTDGDKRNIANMHPDATRYAIFEDDDGWSNEQKFAWMDEGHEGSMRAVSDPASDLAEAFALAEKALPDRYWVFGKGKRSPDEPMYGFLVFDGKDDDEEPIAQGESDNAIEAVRLAIADINPKGMA